MEIFKLNITTILTIATVVVSLICFNNSSIFNKLKHYPLIEYKDKSYFRWLTSGFVHGDYLHLGVNMFVFYQFGTIVEEYFYASFNGNVGSILYIFIYLATIIMANIPTYYKQKHNGYFSSVGASGGVSGIVFIYIMLQPWSLLGLFAIIPIPAIIFGILYLWYSTWSAKNQNDNIDHEAHFYGAIAGILLAIITTPNILNIFLSQLVNTFPL